MNNLALQAAAIVAAHAPRFGTASPPPLDADAHFLHADTVYRAAKTACLRLGFIERDAECVGTAWQAQSDRLGQFDASAWPDHPADFDMHPWPRNDAFAACPKTLGLYAVLPDADWVGRMARAGAPTVQLRFKSDDASAVQREVRTAVKAITGTSALLFINDHWREAIAAGAYGVHLGQEDLEALDPADLQAIRSAGLRLGISTHGYAEMLRADRHSPSYVAMGAVFPTTLKRMATAPQGTARLAAYARLLRDYPLVAIGGIGIDSLPVVLASGVGSVAVVRALVEADSPEAEVAGFQTRLRAFDELPEHRHTGGRGLGTRKKDATI